MYQEFQTGGYSSNQTVRWSQILDDTVEPWVMDGDVLLNWFQLGIFAKDGFASNSGSFSLWGMNFNPLDGRYFLTGIGILKAPGSSDRLATERDLIMLDSNLPNSRLTLPTGVTISNVGGTYKLVDTSENGTFVSSGVQVGDTVTMFPVDIWAEVNSGTFTITQVVSETEVRLDRDPCWYPNSTDVDRTGYLMMLQPHLTLGTFRQNIPYYANDLTAGPKAHYKGGLSLDGTTLYLGDIISNNIIAVNTQQKEDFSIFIPKADLEAYVQAQVDAGRHMAIVNPTWVFLDSVISPWKLYVYDTTTDTNSTTFVYEGDESLAVTYNAAGASIELEWQGTDPLPASYYENLFFAVHGGTSGSQQVDVNIYDSTGTPGTPYALSPLVNQDWLEYEIPISHFGVSTIGSIVFENVGAGAEPTFWLDQIELRYTDPLPAEAGAFTVEDAGPAAAQIADDRLGRIWFSEWETDDIIWTTDGTDLNTFLTSNEIQPVTGATSSSGSSTGVQVMGLTVDQMGTVYWSDNRTKSIWKAPARGGAENIICLAAADDIKTALGLPSSPRGMNCFTIRDGELLTFNFVDGNYIYKVDLDTFHYGDFDADIDNDADDFAIFEGCMAGPDVTEPPVTCDQETFEWCDMDDDGDVDLGDLGRLQLFVTGSIAEE